MEQRLFHFSRCDSCGFAFVNDPRTDYDKVYSEEYYRGKGADPYVDYVFELENQASTIRAYEWRGIVDAVQSFLPVDGKTKWLDFGCGNGGLVRYVHDRLKCEAAGYEHGWIKDAAEAAGIPFLADADLDDRRSYFDVVTAIEVLEHVADPKEVLRVIRSLLRPGGLFFFTTGNAAKHRRNLLEWAYTVPEIHISLYEPQTLSRALTETGFRPEFHGFSPGFRDIIRFKVLKTSGVRKQVFWEKLLPWGLLARLADHHAGVTAQPIGWAI